MHLFDDDEQTELFPCATIIAPVSLSVVGAPRTKKTSNRIVSMGRRCPACKRGTIQRVLPSEAHEEWFNRSRPQLERAWRGRQPIDTPVAVAAVFFREANTGDLAGYIQALGDLLERSGVLKNDRLIASWDGSRLAKDARQPRIQLVITDARVRATTAGRE